MICCNNNFEYVFLEKVYDDANIGYVRGPFPKPTITIIKSYRDCAPSSPIERIPDSTSVNNDSLFMLPPSFDENTADPSVPVDTTNSR